MESRDHTRWRGWFGIGCCLCFLSACGGAEIDEADELGQGQEEVEEGYELVILGEPEAGVQDTGRVEPVAGKEEIADSRSTGAPEQPVFFYPDGEFTVQVAGYEDFRKADKLVLELRAEGYPAYTAPVPGEKGVRVRIGYFRTLEDARRFGQIFKKDRGMEFWVDRRTDEK